MGLETARVMVKRGAKVILACRDVAKGEAALLLLHAEHQQALTAQIPATNESEPKETESDQAEAPTVEKKKSKKKKSSEQTNKDTSIDIEDGSASPSSSDAASSTPKTDPSHLDASGGHSSAPEFIRLDLASFASIRAFAKEFLSKKIPLNILVNNASAMASKYGETEDGLEIMFGVGQVGHFLLTGLLIDKMIQTAEQSGIPSRVVVLTSTAAMTGSRDVIKHPISEASKFSKLGIYSELKLANGLFAMELQRRIDRLGELGEIKTESESKETIGVSKETQDPKDSSTSSSSSSKVSSSTPASPQHRKIIVAAVHPGIVETELSGKMMPSWFFKLVAFTKKTVPQGAATSSFVACHPSLEEKNEGGKYWEDSAPAKATSLMYSKSLAQKLWVRCEKLTHCSFLPQEGEETIEEHIEAEEVDTTEKIEKKKKKQKKDQRESQGPSADNIVEVAQEHDKQKKEKEEEKEEEAQKIEEEEKAENPSLQASSEEKAVKSVKKRKERRSSEVVVDE